MTLSLDSIFQPLNDFFITLFKTDPLDPVVFRFDRFGSVIDDQDFIDPRHPNEYSFNLAREKFSILVNGLPIEDNNCLNIFISQNQIDETYDYQLLEPSHSIGSDSEINVFNEIKSNALMDWENIRLESSTGLMFQFRPAEATPQYWYDAENDNIWTRQQFEISDPAPPSGENTTLIWRLKITNIEMQKLVPVNDSPRIINPILFLLNVLRANERPIMETVKVDRSVNLDTDVSIKLIDSLRDTILELKTEREINPVVKDALRDVNIRRRIDPKLSNILMDAVIIAKIDNNVNLKLTEVLRDLKTYNNINASLISKIKKEIQNSEAEIEFNSEIVDALQDLSIHRGFKPTVINALIDTIRDAKKYKDFIPLSADLFTEASDCTIYDSYTVKMKRMSIRDQLLLWEYLQSNAPTQSSTTKEVSISFDYCIVNIKRHWYSKAFINNKSWYVPNTKKGELTSKNNQMAHIVLMPIGFVAIRNLSIKANWSESDIANSTSAIQFGPFKVDSNIINNSLSHKGIQIIGWLLEKMPYLPPNNDPNLH